MGGSKNKKKKKQPQPLPKPAAAKPSAANGSGGNAAATVVRHGKLEKPWSHVQTGFGLIAFGFALLLVPVVGMALLFVDSVAFERALDATLRNLFRNLALMAGVAGLSIIFIGLALTLTLRRDHPGHKRLRGLLEATFALCVGAVLIVAGTAGLVRWLFAPDAAQSAAHISVAGLVVGAIGGLAAIWVMLGLFSRIAELMKDTRLDFEAGLMRGFTAGLAATVLGVAYAESQQLPLQATVALVAMLYTLTIGGGIWLAWRLARLRHRIGALAIMLEKEAPSAQDKLPKQESKAKAKATT